MRPYEELLKRANQNIQNSDAPSHIKDASNRAFAEVKVEMSNRLTTCAGMACAKHDTKTNTMFNFRIKFSSYIFSHISEEDIFETVSHEFAHIVDFIAHNVNHNHSSIWKNIHCWAGGKGETTHRLPIKRKNIKRIIVNRKPIGGNTLFTIQRFKRISRHSWFTEDFDIVGIAYFNGSKLTHKHIEEGMSVQRCLALI